jgi:hypothetical protein
MEESEASKDGDDIGDLILTNKKLITKWLNYILN